MLKYLIIFLLLPFAAASQHAKVIKFSEFDSMIRSDSHEIQVINFWATWCGPCVKELPQFEELHKRNDARIGVFLISLDFADKIDRVNSFVRRKNMTSPVYLLDEIDYNSWIDKVDKRWNGAIPATLLINTITGKRILLEKELTDGELDNIIREIIKP
jgi:thiol-disulfide isomerase/thioredoxin